MEWKTRYRRNFDRLKPPDPERIERNNKIVKEVLAGKSFAQVGREFNMTRENVRLIVRQMIPKVYFATDPDVDIARIREMLKICRKIRKLIRLPYLELAAKAHLSPDAVKHILKGELKYIVSYRKKGIKKKLATDQVIQTILDEAKQSRIVLDEMINQVEVLLRK